jgi:hypothetical protein
MTTQPSRNPTAGSPSQTPHGAGRRQWRWAPSHRAVVGGGVLAAVLSLASVSAGAATPGGPPPPGGAPHGRPGQHGVRPPATGTKTAPGKWSGAKPPGPMGRGRGRGRGGPHGGGAPPPGAGAPPAGTTSG